MTDDQRAEMGEWLNTQGYTFEITSDGLWWEDYFFGEHTIKDIQDLMESWHKHKSEWRPIAEHDGGSETVDLWRTLEAGDPEKGYRLPNCDRYPYGWRDANFDHIDCGNDWVITHYREMRGPE